MNGNVIRTITIRGTSEGLDKLEADIKKVAAAEQNVAIVSEQAAKSSLTLEQSMAKLERRFVEGVRAAQDYEKIQKEINRAVAQNPQLQERANTVLAAVKERYDQVNTSTKQMITGMSAAGDAGAVASTRMVAGMSALGAASGAAVTGVGLARHELINLGRQAQDVGVSLVSGQSPLMVLAQQGTQIADVFISSGKSVGSFFSQAIGWAKNFFTSTTGIVTGIAAIGVAAVYAASQFVRASTTVEQALEEQNRLLKEGKVLIDARTSAEARSQLQSKEQTQFEMMRNQLDLQVKLNKASEDALNLAQRRAGTPTETPGEMGVAPTAFAALKDPGMDKMVAAFDALKASQAAGLPGLKEYNAELAKIGMAHPELAQVVEDMIKLNQSGMQLERAALQARAMDDALKGIATNAQMAAVGFGSIAQYNLSKLQLDQAKEATERMAVATLRMAQTYPGMSIEAAKMLNSLSGQLQMAQAVGDMAKIEVQHRLRIVELTDKLGSAEASRIAGAERAVALAQIEAQHRQTMVQLQGQLDVASQVTGIGQINAQYEATVASLTQQIGLTKAIEQAEMQRAIAIAQVNTEADRMLRTLQQEGELIRASSDAERDRIKARQTYQDLVGKGVDSTKAQLVASKQLANADEARHKAEREAGEAAIRNIKSRQDAWNAYAQGVISWAVANDEAGKANTRNQREAAAEMERQAAAAAAVQRGIDQMALSARQFTGILLVWRAQWDSIGKTVNDVFDNLQEGKNVWTNSSGQMSQFNPEGYSLEVPQLQLYASRKNPEVFDQLYGSGNWKFENGQLKLDMKKVTERQVQLREQAAAERAATGATNAQTAAELTVTQGLATQGAAATIQGILAGSLGPVMGEIAQKYLTSLNQLLPEEQRASILQQELDVIRQQPVSLEREQLIQQLVDSLNSLQGSVDANTRAITDVFSPFYSSDPRTSKLGFRTFAGGGIMTQYGELPLRHYQSGGMATSPQVAVFGEGSTPEAYVPVPSGRIPVEIKTPANSNMRPVNVTINVMGNADSATAAALKQTGYQAAQVMRRSLAAR
jgi:hypothetical protein